MYCWGRDSGLGIGGNIPASTLVLKVPGPVSGVACAPYAVCAWGASQAVCWGRNDQGQIGNGGRFPVTSPTPVVGLPGATQMSASDGHTCAIDVGGNVLCWGGGAAGRLGDKGTTRFDAAQLVSVP